MQYDDTMHQLFVEEIKNRSNENLILKLKKELRESALELSESSLGTPIIAGMKAKLDSAIPEKELKELEASYRDFKTTLEVGKSSESSGFLAKLRKFSDHVKDNPHYISIINLISSILK